MVFLFRLTTVVMVAFFLSINSTFAENLTIPNTFTAGTPAVAAEVNNNFSEVQTAVNSKQDRVTGTCPIGEAIAAIEEDGSVICEPMPGINYETSGDDISLKRTYRTILSQSLTAPSDGYVLVMFSGILDMNHQNGALTWMAYGINTKGDGSWVPYSYTFNQIWADMPTGPYYRDTYRQAVIPVSAGTTTFYVQGFSNQDNDDTQIYYTHLSLLFFPVRY